MLQRVRSLRPSRAAAVARLGRLRHVAAAAAAATAAAVTAATALQAQSAPPSADVAAMALKAESEADVRIENWSGTHTASPSLYFQPDTPSAVERIVALAHAAGARLRVVGSKISPNGIGLSDEAMLDMAQLDAVLSVDVANRTATVQAGVRVREVVEALRPHGLTLQNYASIAEQQIGGFLQVGAHGTGAGVPPVDEQVIRMVLQTPALGRLELSPTHNPALFHLAKVGLGWLGVVTEVTLQCVPAHKLLQHTFVLTRQEVVERHLDNLRHQHMRYMWLPHTDTVVVVTCDPIVEGMALPPPPTTSESDATRPLRELLLASSAALGKPVAAARAAEMSFAQLRDELLALAPLEREHVIRVNRAEAAFWKQSEGYRVDWSDKLLGFECGGQQWVSEICFPCGTLARPDGNDLRYMRDLLALIEPSDLPTPAPIEQRWTRSSSALMSPAHSEQADDIFSWVGIIMYLPTQDAEQREAITRRFAQYNALCRDKLWPVYGAHQHWAKIEMPESADELTHLRRRLAARFPLAELNQAKRELDPKGILGNTLVDSLLLETPNTASSAAAA